MKLSLKQRTEENLTVSTVTGFFVYERVNRKVVLHKNGLKALVLELIGSEDVIALNIDVFGYLGADSQLSVNEGTCLGYRNGFFGSKNQQSVLLTQDSFEPFLASLDHIAQEDAWVLMKPKERYSTAPLIKALERVPEVVPWVRHETLETIQDLLHFCAFVIIPGGDGSCVEIWSKNPDVPEFLTSAIDASQKCLNQTVNGSSGAHFNDMYSAYVLGDGPWPLDPDIARDL